MSSSGSDRTALPLARKFRIDGLSGRLLFVGVCAGFLTLALFSVSTQPGAEALQTHSCRGMLLTISCRRVNFRNRRPYPTDVSRDGLSSLFFIVLTFALAAGELQLYCLFI